VRGLDQVDAEHDQDVSQLILDGPGLRLVRHHVG
jgi:hypothetical protein